MSFQPLFRRFHEAIQLKRFDENAELVEKRDRVLKRLRENLSITFDWFNQGSYAMGTGVKPLNGDYDIDIGLVFDVNPRSYAPITVKKWVYDAIVHHTTRVEWRRPCITVYYQQAGEAIYHVDLAILAKESVYSNALYLAIGKEHASSAQQEWQSDDRKGFIKAIENKFTGQDAEQFRRVIRYLKRWKDEHFSNQGRAAPTGLSLTVAAYYWFQPAKTGWYLDADYDDLSATASLVDSIKRNFPYGRRLALPFPNAPQDDVLSRMTDQQMREFYQRLEELGGWLDAAQRTRSTGPLRRAFGEDFPEQ